jgi:amino acid permease
MRAVLIVTSIIGAIATGILAALVVVMSQAWDGHASMPLAILGGLAGFLLSSAASVVGYYRDWYRSAAVLGVILLVASAVPWLQSRDKLAGLGMLFVAILLAIDAWKNHESNEEA